MQVDDILSFPFIDPPPQESLLRSLELLYSLGALDVDGKLNEVGKRMARFPLEPTAARCIIAAETEKCAEETIAVLSMLSTDTVFQFTREQQNDIQLWQIWWQLSSSIFKHFP